MTLTLALIATLSVAGSATASTVAQAKQEIRRLWGSQAPRAFCIVGRESSWNPRAVSRTNDHGLFQINAIHARTFGPMWARRYDPVANVDMAWRLYLADGFGPWRGGRWAC